MKNPEALRIEASKLAFETFAQGIKLDADKFFRNDVTAGSANCSTGNSDRIIAGEATLV